MSIASVLIADDERHLTHLLALKLRQEGYEVRIANDGLTALRLSLERVPDLVVSDFQMPGLTGVELATKLRAERLTCLVPVILVTARGHRIDAAELANTNVKDIMGKPFSVRDLLPKVAQFATRQNVSANPTAA